MWYDGLSDEDRAKVETAAKAATENVWDNFVCNAKWDDVKPEFRDLYCADQLAALRAIGQIKPRDVGMEIARECIWHDLSTVHLRVPNGSAFMHMKTIESARSIVTASCEYLAARINAALKDAKEKP